jgi:DNA-binding NarL/FixJ family response regulator
MSRNPPTRAADPEGDKRRALKLAATASQRADVAQTSRNNAIRFAADSGASLREIAAATELSHMTVKRIVDHQRESASSD